MAPPPNRITHHTRASTARQYRVKPTRPNGQWQSDGSDFFVVSWGWYSLFSVLDDYSRFILA